ncbi:MAG: Cof-type HAD-IIB family hydrolase [Streptococcaceae bacterium]|jgi:Cof subfamily protein (haloacid dehalogenase superfamily)|nr:Cof-type HAD-IIB family hydrolase [Streptococcaceae bacterium]
MENLNKYKALAFFDLDGTLLNAESKVDQEVVDGLSQLRENGILPFIATGRGHFELRQIMKVSGITGAIAMNGQYIVLNGEVIYKEAIPTPSITRLLNAAKKQNESLAFYDSKHYWVSELTEFSLKAYEYTHEAPPAVDNDLYLTTEVNMLLVLTDKLSQVEQYKYEVPELNYFMNSPYSIDVTNASTNKGTGVVHVKQVLGFDGPTYAFGDGRNDWHLLSACDYKTAMGNAVPELKEIADYVSTDNTNHGIINAFKHWDLI